MSKTYITLQYFLISNFLTSKYFKSWKNQFLNYNFSHKIKKLGYKYIKKSINIIFD